MLNSRKYRYLPRAALAVLVGLFVFLPAGVGAFELTGRIINGTTNTPLAPATISIVNPSGGMLVENTVETYDDEGHYKIDGLDREAAAYLLRVSHQGVNYTEMVRYDGRDSQTLDIMVYDVTDAWDKVHVSIPHMMLSRFSDTLRVDKLIEIANHSSPPKTVYGEGTRFVFYVPPDAISIEEVSVRSLGIPLPITPTPTDETGFYTIDYPIKPGDTSIEMSIRLPYGKGAYAYSEPLKREIKRLKLVVADPDMRVTSETTDLGDPEDFHSFASHDVGPLQSGDTFAFQISGGRSLSTSATTRVVVVQGPIYGLAVAAMIVLILTLVGFLFTVIGKGHSPDAEEKVLRIQKEELLNQMARLDDLHTMGTVSDRIYKLKRAELMNALAAIYYRTSFKRPAASEPQEEGAARA